MTSTTPNLTPLGDSKHGGALFTLPREVRDQIYRFLVKGHYLVFRHMEPGEHGVSLIDDGTWDKSDLIILRISKAISREAQQIFYSESIFRYPVPFHTRKRLESPNGAVSQMKKIEVDIYNFEDALTTYNHSNQGQFYLLRTIHMPYICGNILGDFTGTDILRDTLHITLRESTPKIISPLRSHVLPSLCVLNEFRTIVIEVLPRLYEVNAAWMWQDFGDMRSNVWSTAEFEQVKQAIKDAMEPALGPAISHDMDSTIHLEFHPR